MVVLGGAAACVWAVPIPQDSAEGDAWMTADAGRVAATVGSRAGQSGTTRYCREGTSPNPKKPQVTSPTAATAGIRPATSSTAKNNGDEHGGGGHEGACGVAAAAAAAADRISRSRILTAQRGIALGQLLLDGSQGSPAPVEVALVAADEPERALSERGWASRSSSGRGYLSGRRCRGQGDRRRALGMQRLRHLRRLPGMAPRTRRRAASAAAIGILLAAPASEAPGPIASRARSIARRRSRLP